MKNSQISWTDHTFNPWSGCTKVSPGCANCYAEALSDRFQTLGKWGKGASRVRTKPSYWRQPLAWNNAQGRHQEFMSGLAERPRVFCASLADWLDEEVPIEWLADLLDLIRQTPNLDWLLLTKRPENWQDRMLQVWGKAPKNSDLFYFVDDWRNAGNTSFRWNPQAPPNVWIGTTVEDQKRADERIPRPLEIPAKVRFLSCEPLLEKVDLMWPESLFPDGPQRCCSGYQCGCHGQPAEPPILYGIDWVIAGGESGPNARPMAPDWAHSLRDQCKAANVPFFMKQMGGTKDKRGDLEDLPDDLRIREFPNTGAQATPTNPTDET